MQWAEFNCLAVYCLVSWYCTRPEYWSLQKHEVSKVFSSLSVRHGEVKCRRPLEKRLRGKNTFKSLQGELQKSRTQNSASLFSKQHMQA